jgi:hypothetical protein
MADTIVTNTPGVTRSADDGASAVGWVVAALVLLAVVVAGFVLYRNGAFSGAGAGGTNINVTVPSGSGGAGGGAGGTGDTGGATQ